MNTAAAKAAASVTQYSAKYRQKERETKPLHIPKMNGRERDGDEDRKSIKQTP